MSVFPLQLVILISTHSLTRRLTGLFPSETWMECISTHSLTRRLTSDATTTAWCFQDFNSQPHEEADVINGIRLYVIAYFNSQPHEEADVDNMKWGNHVRISTHSLTRRLTKDNNVPMSVYIISTHSLTRRLTAFCLRIQTYHRIFQLTASRGGWRGN